MKSLKYTVKKENNKNIHYIRFDDLEQIKESYIPDEMDFSGPSFPYFRDENLKHYEGSACIAYYLGSDEIVQYLLNDKNYIKKAIHSDKVWFLSKEITDMFIF